MEYFSQIYAADLTSVSGLYTGKIWRDESRNGVYIGSIALASMIDLYDKRWCDNCVSKDAAK